MTRRRVRRKTCVRDTDAEIERPPRSIMLVQTAEKLGISAYTYGRLVACGFPMIVMHIMAACVALRGFPEPSLSAVEFFCGVANIHREFSAAGFPSIGIDVLFDRIHHDLCSPQGFIYCLWVVMTMEPDALAWFATVCSTWVWISRSSTGRNIDRPLGRGDLSSDSSLELGNCMVARTAVLMVLAAARHSWWALEQPGGSLMEHHPAMRHVRSLSFHFSFLGWSCVRTSMAAFEADSAKPTVLYSCAPWILALVRKRPAGYIASNQDVAIKTTNTLGAVGVTGGSGLKRTQAYTPEFARAVVDAFVCCRNPEVIDDDDDAVIPEQPAVWETGRFEESLRLFD